MKYTEFEDDGIDENRDYGGMGDSEDIPNSEEDGRYKSGLLGLTIFAIVAFLFGFLALWHWK